MKAPFLLLALLLLPFSSSGTENPPRVVVTLQPIHSLVAGVMEGVGTPELLLPAGASPHSYALRPSQMRSLSRADAVFWVGEELESFLLKTLQSLQGLRTVSLSKAPGMRLFPARSGGVWEEDDHGHGDHHEHSDHDGENHLDYDPHLWLDPENAKKMVEAIATELSALSPPNASRFTQNAREMTTRLSALDEELKRKLAPVKKVPYIVFHDGYRYFEEHYGLHPVGAITLSPERAPGVRRLGEIRNAIRERGARCIFAEPQFEPKLVDTVVEGTPARTGVLDPLGASIPPGPEAYFTLMRNMGESLTGCLAKD